MTLTDILKLGNHMFQEVDVTFHQIKMYNEDGYTTKEIATSYS